MNKAKVFSAAAMANMAAVGFAAAPAIASTHPAVTSAGAAVPAAGRSLPGITFVPRGGAATAAAAAARVKPRGFVPRAAKGVKPDTETGCNSYICVGLYGGGNYVSYFNAHWYGGSPGACRVGILSYTEPNGDNAWVPYYTVCYKSQIQLNFDKDFPTGTKFCAEFSGLPGTLCEPVR
jgi:hypothetical protein